MKFDDVVFGMGILALGVIAVGCFLMALGVYDIVAGNGASDCAAYVRAVINTIK